MTILAIMFLLLKLFAAIAILYAAAAVLGQSLAFVVGLFVK